MKLIVVHYDEIALKGGRRRFFERKLIGNIRTCWPALAEAPIRRLGDRLLIGPLPDDSLPAVEDRLSSIPGISWFAEVRRLPLEVESLRSAADGFVAAGGVRSFRVTAQRSKKDFPRDSLEIHREVGRMIQERTGWQVDLEKPDLTVYIDVTPRGILVYHAKRPGLGGLPVGSSGKLACLLSGGIDSPVAAFRMMCRGCSMVFVHFHNFGPDSVGVRGKIVRLVGHFCRFQPVSRVYLVPFAKVQADLVAAIPSRMRMVAYRRAMLRLATPILEAERAKGFVVGDSVGQVASQTLDNLRATYPATDYPVFAPLIGESKRSITEQARRIGTYETSILPYEDCCQLLVARSPATECTLPEILEHESRLPVDRHFDEVREEIEVVEVTQPDVAARRLRFNGTGPASPSDADDSERTV